MSTICIDFDGVIHDYSKGWQGDDVFDKPVEGASEGLKALKAAGWTIILFTTRKSTAALYEFLAANDLTVDYVNWNPDQPKNSSNKLIADVYLDDRGICFDGDWKKAVELIKSFKPWQAKNDRDQQG